MKTFKKILFEHDKKRYEIRIMYDDTSIKLVTFFDNHPVNGFRYMINFPKKFNMSTALQIDKLNKFITISQQDIIEDRWKSFIEG